jgi:hypothetical protein
MEYIEFLGLRPVPTFSCSQLCNKEPQYLATQDYHMLIEQLGEVRENVVNSALFLLVTVVVLRAKTRHRDERTGRPWAHKPTVKFTFDGR